VRAPSGRAAPSPRSLRHEPTAHAPSHPPARRPAAARRAAAAAPPRALFGGLGGGKDGAGGLGGLMENIKKAQAMVQVEAAKVQEELSAAEFEGFSSDESVRAVFSGNQEPRAVEITAEAYAQGAEALQALVLEAVRDSHGRSVAGMKARMATMAQSLGLPQPPAGMGGM
jgi:DNA-binding protein YbaB